MLFYFFKFFLDKQLINGIITAHNKTSSQETKNLLPGASKMKLFKGIMKLAVLLLALPVFILIVLEGVFLVFTDGIPGFLKKFSLLTSRANN